MVKVSVVVPVYNSEKYIRGTIKSILDQESNQFDMEVILINDGSQDNSAEICKSIAQKDQRILYINQENHGISYTRNKGMRLATGDYLLFCDGDDTYINSLIKDNVDKIIKTKADVVKFGRISRTNDGTEWRSKFYTREFNFNSLNRNEQFIELSRGDLLTYIWDAIYDIKFLKKNSVLFDESMIAGEEDRNFNFQLVLKKAKISVNPHYYYIHYIRYGRNTTSKYNPNRINALKKNIKMEENICNLLSIDKVYSNSELLEFFRLYVIEIGKSSNLTWHYKKKLLKSFSKEYDINKITLVDILRSKDRVVRNLIFKLLDKLNWYGILYKCINR